jgi:hypothetical protein
VEMKRRESEGRRRARALSRRDVLKGSAAAGALAFTVPAVAARTGGDPAGAAPADHVFDVADFGARGDGVTDDTAAIQRAVDMCVNGGTVWFPVGLYLTSGAIDISGRPGINLAGPPAGQYFTSGGLDLAQRVGAVLMLTRDDQVGISSDRSGQGAALHQGPVIEGLTVVARPGVTGAVGYKNVGVNRFTLRNCGFFYLDTGVRIAYSPQLGASEWGMIDQCSVSNCSTYGLDLDTLGLTVIGGEFTASGRVANILIRRNSANVRLIGLKVNVGTGDGIVCRGTLCQMVACNLERDNAGAGSLIKIGGAPQPPLSGRSNSVIACAGSGKGTGTGVTVTNQAAYTTVIALAAHNLGAGVRDAGVRTTVQNAAGDFKFPAKIGFYGKEPVARQVVSGSRRGGAALASLLDALAASGLVVDNSSP